MRSYIKVGALAWMMVFITTPVLAQGTLQIQLEIPKQQQGPYHRPYVAIWIETLEEQPVRLIELWREKPDWIKDLRRFWRKTGRSEQTLVDARTGATKGPGKYQVSWQGVDDKNLQVAPGRYLLVIEAAREQGGRNLVKQEFNWDDQPIAIEISAGTELGTIYLTKGSQP